METLSADAQRANLIRDGFCHVPAVVAPDLVEQVRAFADDAAASLPAEEQERSRFQGSLIQVKDREELVPLIALPAALNVLAGMGFSQPKFWGGYIISKPPERAPALFWHQDGVVWGGPSSYTDTPVQVFLMYYLIDTNRQNGCLRVIPGSHRRRHRLHALPPAHGANFAAAGEGHAAFQPDPDEVDVPVRAGDLLIGDARLIHSAHPNRSAQRRTVITLWFVPAFGELSEHLQAFYGRFGGKAPERPTGWTDASWRQLEPILARYDGAAEPATSIRIPNARLL